MQKRNYLDGGEAILEAFRNLGVDYILSSPGSEWSPVWEAMARQTVEKNAGPQFLDCWHETVAVDMALGYTAYTGRPQAVLIHAGVGLMHGSMAIVSAAQEEIPVVVMSGEATTFGDDPDQHVEPQFYGGVSVGGAHRWVDPIVKWATQVTSAPTLYNTVVRSMELAQRQPQGPVYINVSLECMLQEWKKPTELAPIAPAPKTAPLQQDVDSVAELLKQARNPVILVEGAGRDPKAFSALVELAESLAIPVVNGRASVYTNLPKSSPMWMGYSNLKLLDDSDLILLISGKAPWYPPSNRPGKGKIVAISENPLKMHLAYQVLFANQYLEGDVATSLRMLTKAAAPSTDDLAKIDARKAMWTAEHDKLVAGLADAAREAVKKDTLDAVGLGAVFAEVMPKDVIVCDETITHMPLLRPHLPLNEPQSFFRVTGGGLGQGIGAALGAKLAAPHRPVVLFIGDGSFLYNPIVQALGASQTYKLPIIIVVCNNTKYEAMRKGHVLYYEGGVSDTTKVHYGVNIKGPKYEELGSHFDCVGAKAANPAELRQAFEIAFAANVAGKTAILNILLTR